MSFQSNIKKLLSLLDCISCNKPLISAKLLNCGHFYCIQCTINFSQGESRCIQCYAKFSLEQSQDLDFQKLHRTSLQLQSLYKSYYIQSQESAEIDKKNIALHMKVIGTGELAGQGKSLLSATNTSSKLPDETLEALENLHSSQSSDSSFDIPTQSEVISLYFNKSKSQLSIQNGYTLNESLKLNTEPAKAEQVVDLNKKKSNPGKQAKPQAAKQNTGSAKSLNKHAETNLEQLNINKELVLFTNTKGKRSNHSNKRASLQRTEVENNSKTFSNDTGPAKKQKLEKSHTANEQLELDLAMDRDDEIIKSPTEDEYSSSLITSSSFTSNADKVTLMVSGLSSSDKKWFTNYSKRKHNKLDFDLIEDVDAIIKSFEIYKKANTNPSKKSRSQTKSFSQPAKSKSKNPSKVEITHLVVGADKSNLAARTVKYMTGVMMGAHIVSIQWLKDSAKKGEMVDEKKYYVNHDRSCKGDKGKVPERSGPSYGRLAKLGLIPDVFDNFFFVLVNKISFNSAKSENFLSNTNIAELSFLLELGGGTVCNSATFYKILRKIEFDEDEDLGEPEATKLLKQVAVELSNTQNIASKKKSSTTSNYTTIFIMDDDKCQKFTLQCQEAEIIHKSCNITKFISVTASKTKPVKWVYDSISIYEAIN